jgi:hypothetical protein
LSAVSEYASLDSNKIIHFADTLAVEPSSGAFEITKRITTKVDGVEVGNLRMMPEKLYTWCSKCFRMVVFMMCSCIIWCWLCYKKPKGEEISYAANVTGMKEGDIESGTASLRWKRTRQQKGKWCCIKEIANGYIPCYCIPCVILKKLIKRKFAALIKTICSPCRMLAKRFNLGGGVFGGFDDGPNCRHRRNGFWCAKLPGNDGYTPVGYVVQHLTFDNTEFGGDVHPTSGQVPTQIMGYRNTETSPTDFLCAASVLKHQHTQSPNLQLNQFGMLDGARQDMMPDQQDPQYGYGWIKAFTVEEEHDMTDLTHASQCGTCMAALERGRTLTCPLAEKQRVFDTQLNILKKQVEKSHTVKEAITEHDASPLPKGCTVM